MFTKSGAAALCGAMLFSAAPFARAQEPDRTVLPIPSNPFKGRITNSFSTSIPEAFPPIRAPFPLQKRKIILFPLQMPAYMPFNLRPNY